MRMRERGAEAEGELVVKLFCTAREKIQQPGHRRRWKFCSALLSALTRPSDWIGSDSSGTSTPVGTAGGPLPTH